MISGIDFVSLPVVDMQRAKRFYEDTLGLTHQSGGDVWREYDMGDGPALAVVDMKGYGMPTEPAETGSVGLAFGDIDAIAKKLHEAGFLPGELHDSPSCRAGFAQDSEGNAIVIHQRKDEPTRNHRIDFICVPIQQMARARTFYEGKLGLKPETVHGESWTEYVLDDGSALALGDIAAMGKEFKPVTAGAVGLRTSNVEALFAELKGEGFAMEPEIQETDVCFMGFVKDTEGNALVLHRRKQ